MANYDAACRIEIGKLTAIDIARSHSNAEERECNGDYFRRKLDDVGDQRCNESVSRKDAGDAECRDDHNAPDLWLAKRGDFLDDRDSVERIGAWDPLQECAE